MKKVILREGAPDADPTPTVTVGGWATGVEEVVFIDRDRRARCEATVRNGRYRVENLFPGPFRVFARTPESLLVGMPALEEEEEGDFGGLEGFIDKVEEFFDEKRIRFLSGTAENLWILLESRRRTPSHLKDQETGEPILTIRWDIWIARRGEADWEIETRLFLFRDSIVAGEEFPELSVEQRQELADIGIEEDLVLDLER